MSFRMSVSDLLVTRLDALRVRRRGYKMTTEWWALLRDAIIPPVFWEREARVSGSELVAADQRLMGTRARRLRVGFLGFFVGLVILVFGYRWGLAVDDWLEEATGGAWSYWSNWLGDVAGVPFLLGAMGGMITLSGADRVLTSAMPWFATGGRMARTLRLGSAVILGTAIALAAFAAGVVRV